MTVEVDRGSFATLLRRFRLEAGMSQEVLAERANLSAESIGALERGRRRAPYPHTIGVLAEALDLSDAQREELVAAAQRSKPPIRASIAYDSGESNPADDDQSRIVVGHNLPHAAAPMYGRTGDIRRLGTLLAGHRLVTIFGAGGVGKTRVAIEVARLYLESSGSKTWFIDLAPLRSGALIASTICTAIGVAPPPDRPAIESVITQIASDPALLVLDNCEHVIEEAGHVVQTLLARCTSVRILTTSREALHIDSELAVRLPSLDVPAVGVTLDEDAVASYSSVTLFFERAKACGSDVRVTPAMLADAAQICRRLDGIPLAIELAAARTQMLSVVELRRRLDQTFNVLSEGPRRGLPRQQTIRAVIDWSYDLLSEGEQQLFIRLSAFPGGCTLDAAQAVCCDEQLSGAQIIDTLASLVRKSLVVADTGGEHSRYRLLESTRSYAQSKLSPAQADALAQRLAAWVADFTGASNESSARWKRRHWLEVFSAELSNIRAALNASMEAAGDIVLAARIAGDVAHFWFEAGLQSEGRYWIETILDRAGEIIDDAVLGRLWWASAYLSSGARVVSSCERAITLLQKAGRQSELATAYVHLSMGLWQAGRLPEALQAITEALGLVGEGRMQHTLRYAEYLDAKASILNALGEFDQARATFGEATDLFLLLSDAYGAARSQAGLAELEFACGDVDEAIVLSDEAAITFEHLGSTSRLAAARANSAAYRVASGEVSAGGLDAVAALDLALRSQDKPITSVAIQTIALVLSLRGRAKAAALLDAYVSRWYEREGYQRERTEQKIYELLQASLTRQLTPAERSSSKRNGAMLSEEKAVEAARTNCLDVLADDPPTLRV